MNSKKRFFYSLFLCFIVLMQGLFADSFRLVSYSILSADPTLSWEDRRLKLVERIQQCDPDVICLHDLNLDSFAFFEAALGDFEGAFAKKGNNSGEGIGTFCKRGVFAQVEHQAILCEGTSNCGCNPVQPALLSTLCPPSSPSILLINTQMKKVEDKPSLPILNHIQCLIESTQDRTLLVGNFKLRPDHFLIREFAAAGLHDVDASKWAHSTTGNCEIIDNLLFTSNLQCRPLDPYPIGCVISYE